MANILIIDDEKSMRRILSLILAEEDHKVAEASGFTEAMAELSSSHFDIAITDKRMQDGDGLDVINECRTRFPAMPVVMLTAYATVESAVEAMQAGAFDFISKPFVPDVVKSVVRRAVERASLVRENERLKIETARFAFTDEILGNSSPINALRATIERVAPTNATVLINGETGTGKELAARAIHRGSQRSQNTFLAVNCAAFSEQILDSELFGHEKGAFTGADRTKIGLFEAADGGTLFLDEAGEMSLGLQAKLLRVIAEGKVIRVGSTTVRTVDVRVIVATHRNLEERVRTGTFREDLYYRLAVVPITIPPLRERREDIPLLVEYLVGEIAKELKSPPRPLSKEALAKLANYDFPGNVRELRNLLERASILAAGSELTAGDFLIAARDMPSDGTEGIPFQIPEGSTMSEYLESIEKRLIEDAIAGARGVQAEAARRLGISRSDIAYKIKKYDI